MVCDVFSEHNECHRDIGNREHRQVGTEGADAAEFVVPLESFDEGEIRVPLHMLELGEVNDLEHIVLCRDTDQGKHRSYTVAGEDAEHEGNHLGHLLPVDRADDDNCERYQRADQAECGMTVHHTHAVAVQIHTDCIIHSVDSQ